VNQEIAAARLAEAEFDHFQQKVDLVQAKTKETMKAFAPIMKEMEASRNAEQFMPKQ
jgi:hypothetical protein